MIWQAFIANKRAVAQSQPAHRNATNTPACSLVRFPSTCGASNFRHMRSAMRCNQLHFSSGSSQDNNWEGMVSHVALRSDR